MRIYETIPQKGMVLKGLSLKSGDKVKVILREVIKKKGAKKSKYPLRGKAVHYERPFDSIAEEDWAVLRWSSLICISSDLI